MPRGVGEFAIQEAIPESLAVVVALMTQLGDIWFVSLLLVALFVRFEGVERDRIATIGGLVIGAIALVFAFKYTFELPRPNQPLVALGAIPPLLRPVYEASAHASGYGFPSGHAIVSTATYLALAETLSVSTRRRRYTAAAALIAVVSFSRIALGVHFLVDVLAGIGISAVFLILAFRLLARYRTQDARRTVALGLGVVLAIVSVITSGAHIDSVLLLVISSGIFGLFWYFDRPRTARLRDRTTDP